MVSRNAPGWVAGFFISICVPSSTLSVLPEGLRQKGMVRLDSVENVLQEEARGLDLRLDLRQTNLTVGEHRYLLAGEGSEPGAAGLPPGFIGAPRCSHDGGSKAWTRRGKEPPVLEGSGVD